MAGMAMAKRGEDRATVTGGAGAPPTRKGRETREKFRDALRSVIETDGYLNAKIADVAERAGKTPGLFYSYYDSKEELLADIAEDLSAELARTTTEPFRAGLPPDEALYQAIRVFWNTFKRRKAEMIGIFQASMTDQRFAAEWRRMRAQAIKRVVVGIEAAKATGHAPDMDAELAGSALISMLENFAYVWLAGGGDQIDKPFDEEQAIRTVWQIWYHGIYWQGKAPRGGR